VVIAAVKRCIQQQNFRTGTISGEELVEWRQAQAGEYNARNGEVRPGWTQKQAAEWIGVSWRTWQRWEAGATLMPEWAVRRICDYSMSLNQVIERALS
jgi:DNA-binding XRE family transcriptional regulator